MMMRMLEAGGLPALTDNERSADQDNPRGYYEYERVKDLATDKAWVPEAKGRAVKVISALLEQLPRDQRYRVVFMRRDISEVMASQREMLARKGKAPGDEERMTRLFLKHLSGVEATLASAPQIEVLYVRYADVVRDPHAQASVVNRFLGGDLDEQRMAAMVDPALHRQNAG